MDNEAFVLVNPELEAEIYYLTQNEGGRNTPVRNGYRGQFYYNGQDWDAHQQFIETEWCNPGETVRVSMQMASPAYHVGKIKEGMEFEIREGLTTVGNGRVTQILREDFRYWDPESFIKSLPVGISPCHGDDFSEVGIDFRRLLTCTDIMASIRMEMKERLECMVVVRWILEDKNLSGREVADRIIECWKNEAGTANHLYKVDLQLGFNDPAFKFTLEFVAWSTVYVTGQLVVTRKPARGQKKIRTSYEL